MLLASEENKYTNNDLDRNMSGRAEGGSYLIKPCRALFTEHPNERREPRHNTFESLE